MADVLGYLESKALFLKRADSRNVHTACIFCDEPSDARGRLYICTDPDADIPGLFLCHRCGAKGNLTTLKKHFGDQIAEDEVDYHTRSEILNRAAAYYQGQLGDYPEVLRYLKGAERGLSMETIARHEIGYAPMDREHDLATDLITWRKPRLLYSFLRSEGYTPKDIIATGLCYKDEKRNAVVDSLAGMVTLPYHTAGNVVAIRGRTWPYTEADFAGWDDEPYEPAKGKYKTVAGTQARLFNADAMWGTDDVVITEGEFDALVLEQEGFPAVGVPGANSWQEAWDDYIKPLKRVYLVFDRDAAGEKAANTLVERFGTKVRRVHLSPEGTKCDPTQWFAQGHGGDELRALIDDANRGGLLVSVREAILEYSTVQGQPGVKFGWDYLDIAIAPGLQAAQLMVPLSKTGVGKTIVLLNMMHGVRMQPGQEDFKILFVSLEQTRGEWWDRARRIHRFFDLDANEADAEAWWENNLMLVDRNRVSEVEFRQVIDDFTYQMGKVPDLLCVDYLGYWARSFKGDAYQRTSDAIMALKAIAKDYRIPIIAPHQVSRGAQDGLEFQSDSARDAGVVEETADFIVAMWAPDNQMGREEAERTGVLHMRLAKSRHGGRGQLFPFQFAPISLAIVPETHHLAVRARKEFGWKTRYRDDWNAAVYRHVTGFEGILSLDTLGRLREEP